MVNLNDIVGTATRFLDEHPDAVSAGLDKVGDPVDKGTKGTFHDQVQQGRDLAKDKLVHGDRTTPEAPANPSATSPAGL